MGVSVVNALSSILTAKVFRDGNIYEMTFAKGKPTGSLSQREESLPDMKARYLKWYGEPAQPEPTERAVYIAEFGKKLSGTDISFMPDATIFETTHFDYDVLLHRLMELAFLNSNISIAIRDDRSGDSQVFCYAGGIREFVTWLNTGTTPTHPDVIVLGKKDPEDRIEADVAFQYTNTYNEQVFSFVNSVNTREGGTHLEGFRSAITRAINSSAKKNNLIKDAASVSVEKTSARDLLLLSVSKWQTPSSRARPR